MFEALLQFLKELIFKNEIIDIRNKNFNFLSFLTRTLVVLSFMLNYFLINRYIKLADKHYKLQVAVIELSRSKKECVIDLNLLGKK
jgi:hypothetical protein